MQAEAVQALYPTAEFVGVPAGHCPHDDDPLRTNAALSEWLQGLDAP